MNPDYKRNGVEHLEREGCIINIRYLHNLEGEEVTGIEILPDNGWVLDGTYYNRVIKKGEQ